LGDDPSPETIPPGGRAGTPHFAPEIETTLNFGAS
jgi:hypothetical protein